VLCAADEVAVGAFLDGRLSFPAITKVVEMTLAGHTVTEKPALDGILESDGWARRTAADLVEELSQV
jgi:1-deoxy-D-xylulose-5-phosphate reductoisomerase